MRFAQLPQRSGGPWGPQGPHEPPRGIFGPFGAPRAPPGAPGDSGGAPGAPQRLREHFLDTPDFGLPAASRRPAPRGLAAAPGGLAAAPGWPWMAWRRPPEAWRRPPALVVWQAVASGGFFPATMTFFEKMTCTSKIKSAPGRLSRPQDLSRSTRAVVLRRGVSRRARDAD